MWQWTMNLSVADKALVCWFVEVCLPNMHCITTIILRHWLILNRVNVTIYVWYITRDFMSLYLQNHSAEIKVSCPVILVVWQVSPCFWNQFFNNSNPSLCLFKHVLASEILKVMLWWILLIDNHWIQLIFFILLMAQFQVAMD